MPPGRCACTVLLLSWSHTTTVLKQHKTLCACIVPVQRSSSRKTGSDLAQRRQRACTRLSCPCPVYVLSLSCTYPVLVVLHLACTWPALGLHSCTCPALVLLLSCICPAFVLYLNCACPVLVLYLWCTYIVLHVQCVLCSYCA